MATLLFEHVVRVRVQANGEIKWSSGCCIGVEHQHHLTLTTCHDLFDQDESTPNQIFVEAGDGSFAATVLVIFAAQDLVILRCPVTPAKVSMVVDIDAVVPMTDSFPCLTAGFPVASAVNGSPSMLPCKGRLYPGDPQKSPSLNLVLEDGPKNLVNEMQGASGSPVFIERNGDLVLVAIIRSGQENFERRLDVILLGRCVRGSRGLALYLESASQSRLEETPSDDNQAFRELGSYLTEREGRKELRWLMILCLPSITCALIDTISSVSLQGTWIPRLFNYLMIAGTLFAYGLAMSKSKYLRHFQASSSVTEDTKTITERLAHSSSQMWFAWGLTYLTYAGAQIAVDKYPGNYIGFVIFRFIEDVTNLIKAVAILGLVRTYDGRDMPWFGIKMAAGLFFFIEAAAMFFESGDFSSFSRISVIASIVIAALSSYAMVLLVSVTRGRIVDAPEHLKYILAMYPILEALYAVFRLLDIMNFQKTLDDAASKIGQTGNIEHPDVLHSLKNVGDVVSGAMGITPIFLMTLKSVIFVIIYWNVYSGRAAYHALIYSKWASAGKMSWLHFSTRLPPAPEKRLGLSVVSG